MPISSSCFELIETLWNVNFYESTGYGTGAGRINRNIVECKLPWTTGSDTTSSELIETLWNVNMGKCTGRSVRLWN